MNWKQNAIRVSGQRSVASSFLSASSNPFKKNEEEVNDKLSNKENSFVSLSDFLDLRLHRSSVVPKEVKGKSSPFVTPVGLSNASGVTDGQMEGEERRINVLDKLVFEQFKQTSSDKEDTLCSSETANEDNVKESRKRRNPFEAEKQTTQKPFVVLGDDSKWKRKRRIENSMNNKKPRPSYNHYANGCGWWDCGMEGVDDEEVGYGEVWEGVGSTTFGGIEWH